MPSSLESAVTGQGQLPKCSCGCEGTHASDVVTLTYPIADVIILACPWRDIKILTPWAWLGEALLKVTKARKFLFLTLNRTPKGVAVFLERGPPSHREACWALLPGSISPGHSLEGSKSPHSGGRQDGDGGRAGGTLGGKMLKIFLS